MNFFLSFRFLRGGMGEWVGGGGGRHLEGVGFRASKWCTSEFGEIESSLAQGQCPKPSPSFQQVIGLLSRTGNLQGLGFRV